jgi:5-methylcytosine-specific restriction protein A
VYRWEEIKAAHVKQAMKALDAAPNQSEFLKEIGFGPARTRVLIYQGRQYPSKALIGIARSYTSYGKIKNNFHGGEGNGMPVTILTSLGFITFADRTLRDDTQTTEEIEGSPSGYPEGAVQQVLVNKYERNRDARAECLRHRGCRCKVCKFDFSERYGEHGAGFIHVHHTKKLSEVGEGYVVDPVEELIPLCPNCHAMIHRTKDMLTVDELRKMIRRLPARSPSHHE